MRARTAHGPCSVLALVALASCSPAPRTQVELPGSSDWDLVLIVLDSLPASALSCYGYRQATTPRIDAFAEQALRFEQVFTSASSTLPSTVSLFTGLSPAAHGCVGPGSNVLARDHQTLPETLEEAGFRSLGVSTNPFVTAETGFAQGFETFEYRRAWTPVPSRVDDPDDVPPHVVPAGLVDEAVQWWRRTVTSDRRFLYLHLLPPHAPYDPPEPWNLMFDAERTERIDGAPDRLRRLAQGGQDLAPDDPPVRDARRRYDAELAYVDSVVGDLLDALELDRGLADAVVVITSDHGEAFGEHGRILHGDTVYAETTRVPLIVRWPLMEPGTHAGLVRQRDLAATLGELLELAWPKGAGNGRSFLRPAVEGQAELTPLCLSRTDGEQPVWALRAARWNLFLNTASGATELYDRLADPAERKDVAAGNPETVAELTERLNQLLEKERSRAGRLPRPISVRAHLEDLAALGYASGE